MSGHPTCGCRCDCPSDLHPMEEGCRCDFCFFWHCSGCGIELAEKQGPLGICGPCLEKTEFKLVLPK